MVQDLTIILKWWLFIAGIGLIFLPLTKKVFANFFDQGYLFAKVLGILFSSYFVWLLASLKILPFNQLTILLVLILGVAVNFLIFRKNRICSHSLLIIFLLEEIMFLTTLIGWSLIRGFQPDIQGLEKFMDFGFVNSILKARYFPPIDMWFAGKSINYYYFGHFITAFLTRLSGINPAITYNLMIATLFAFCFSLTFSLTGNLIYFSLKNNLIKMKLIIISGLISAFLISLGANLHPSFYNFKMKILNKPYCDGAKTYWYPNATRYIGYCPDVDDKTIHEFPSYSFIVSDLHGHVSDIPFVLLFLAFCLNLTFFLKEKKSTFLTFDFCLLILPMSLTLAIMYMTNQWDYPIYLMVLGFILLWGFYQHYGLKAKTLIKSVPLGIAIILFSIIFFLPFQFGFDPIVKGIDFVKARSLPHQLLILWGAPWFFGLTFLVFLFGYKIKSGHTSKKEILIKWFSELLGVEIKLKKENSSPQTTSYKLIPTDTFVLILFLVSTLLVFIPELIFVKDIYIASYHRANTVFKLTYQSFVMFSICIGYIFARLLSKKQKNFTFYILYFTFSILIFMLMFYPNYSIPGYYGRLNQANYKGLYGLKFLERLYPDDYKLIGWLNNNITDQPVVLEAVGDSYTDYERISMATGLPTVEGWLVHEWLWRGSYDEPGKRAGEVQTIYESNDLNQTKELLKKYQVKYVVIGEMEREKYKEINEEKFSQIGKEVFKSGKTALFELIQ